MLNRFIQPDSIVPNPVSPQDFNRFSYVINNPINLTDPSGHCYYNGTWIPNGQDGTCSWQSDSNDNDDSGGDSGGDGGGGDGGGDDYPEDIDDFKMEIIIGQEGESTEWGINGETYRTTCINPPIHCSTMTIYIVTDFQEETAELLVSSLTEPYSSSELLTDTSLFLAGFTPIGTSTAMMSFAVDVTGESIDNQVNAVIGAILKTIIRKDEPLQPIAIAIYNKILNESGQNVNVITTTGYNESYVLETGGLWVGGQPAFIVQSMLNSIPLTEYNP